MLELSKCEVASPSSGTDREYEHHPKCPGKKSPPEIYSFPDSDGISRARVLDVCLGGMVEEHSSTGNE